VALVLNLRLHKIIEKFIGRDLIRSPSPAFPPKAGLLPTLGQVTPVSVLAEHQKLPKMKNPELPRSTFFTAALTSWWKSYS